MFQLQLSTGHNQLHFCNVPTKVKRSIGGRTQQILLKLSPTFPKSFAEKADRKKEKQGQQPAPTCFLVHELHQGDKKIILILGWKSIEAKFHRYFNTNKGTPAELLSCMLTLYVLTYWLVHSFVFGREGQQFQLDLFHSLGTSHTNTCH